MMRAHINSLVLLLRSPRTKVFDKSFQRPSCVSFSSSRRLHSDAPAVSVPVEEPRSPLEDLLGRRHDYLRISLTERCNLRCQYCMPAGGVPLTAHSGLLSAAEIVRLGAALAKLGVRKVRLTGGEPSLRRDLLHIVQELSSIPGIESVAMTTNGLVLTRMLPALQRAGLSRVNISLDSLRPDRYERMARRPGLSRVLAGIDLALQLGYDPVKVNVVLMKGFNDDEIGDFVEFTKDRAVEVRFIEFMPFSGNAWADQRLVPHKEAVRALTEAHPTARPALPRPHDTARVWKVPGYRGAVGFISSMTNHFCHSCNRLRITADGNLKVCLFGSAEVSLRDALRAGASDSELEDLIRAALRNKKPQHAAAAPTAARITTTVSSARNLLSKRPAFHVPPALFKPTNQVSARAFSTDDAPIMSHLDSDGRARMVDVSHKPVTSRVAAAECSLRVGGKLIKVLKDSALPKGDALTVAQIAGVVGAKKTSELIPMCHPLPLDYVDVKIQLPKGECNDGGDILVRCEVRAEARTGAEMEALTGAAVAALALYDMCKSVDKHMRVTNLRVVSKAGGRSGAWPPAVRPLNTSPIKGDEAFVPTNVMHF